MALLVSLIALVVAFLQLCQQYFATADGYRNCAESVIGPWHRTRHRRPVRQSSASRQSTTLRSFLSSISECADRINDSDQHEKRVHLLYPLHPNPCCEGERLLYETVRPLEALPYALPGGWRSKLPKWTGLRAIPKGTKAKYDGEEGSSTFRREYMEQSSAIVSWIGQLIMDLKFWRTCIDCVRDFAGLMRALHLTYSLYGQVSNSDDLRAVLVRREIEQHKSYRQVTSNSTQPVVEQRRVHWDFLDSKITRPVAQTRIGDIILFALRMGMQWRTINVETGTLLAVGNGYSLSSANPPGLILTFTNTGHHEKPPSIIPSQYADKMLFGILPGDPDLVKRDFSLVGRGGEVDGDESILRRILKPHGLDSGDRIKFETLAARSDLKKLLCPFLPQKYPNTAPVRFLGWPWHRGASFLHFFESRVAFVQKLDAEVRRHPSQYGKEDATLLQNMKTRLDELKDKYPEDFYCVRFTSRQILSATSSKQDSYDFNSFLQKCEDIFESCTKNLKEHGWGLEVDNGPEGGSTKFALLVAAHTAMTNNATKEAKEEYLEAKGRPERQYHGDWAEVMGLEQQAPPKARDRQHAGNPIFYFRMNKIVQHMKSEDRGIRQELGKLGVEVTDTEAQLVWWMMMIRGIAWDMSCYRESWPADEDFVPSTFYGDPTPVMLA